MNLNKMNRSKLYAVVSAKAQLSSSEGMIREAASYLGVAAPGSDAYRRAAEAREVIEAAVTAVTRLLEEEL